MKKSDMNTLDRIFETQAPFTFNNWIMFTSSSELLLNWFDAWQENVCLKEMDCRTVCVALDQGKYRINIVKNLTLVLVFRDFNRAASLLHDQNTYRGTDIFLLEMKKLWDAVVCP
jgi:hypothetical protein